MAAVFRAVFGYCFLIFIIRIESRRPGKQITPFEFVLIFFLGGLTLTTLVADDRSLTNAICIVVAIALTHFALAWLKTISPTLGRVLDGTPMVLLNKGQWELETLKKMRLQDDDVMAMARDQGLKSLEQIDYAVLERNGEISIIPGKSK